MSRPKVMEIEIRGQDDERTLIVTVVQSGRYPILEPSVSDVPLDMRDALIGWLTS